MDKNINFKHSTNFIVIFINKQGLNQLLVPIVSYDLGFGSYSLKSCSFSPYSLHRLIELVPIVSKGPNDVDLCFCVVNTVSFADLTR